MTVVPTSIASRITYGSSEPALVYSPVMTIAARFRTPTFVNPALIMLLVKAVVAETDNQFLLCLAPGLQPICYVAASAADLANAFSLSTPLSVATEYTMHVVYNGTLVAGSRGIIYVNGASPGTSISGTLPTAMRASAAKLTVFNAEGGAWAAPASDFILRDLRVYSAAWSAAEVQDDYLKQTQYEIWGGGA